jgi:hypothetical protein
MIRNFARKAPRHIHLSVKIDDKCGAVWTKLEENLKGTICGDTPVSDYAALSPYFRVLRGYDDDDMVDLWYGDRIGQQDLVASRVAGDMQAFRHHHQMTLDYVNRVIRLEQRYAPRSYDEMWVTFGEELIEAFPAQSVVLDSSCFDEAETAMQQAGEDVWLTLPTYFGRQGGPGWQMIRRKHPFGFFQQWPSFDPVQ